MKQIFIFILILLTFGVIKAQDYYITFIGTGVSTTIDSVMIENINKGSKITLKGDDILHLSNISAIHEQSIQNNSRIELYPNPVANQSYLQFYANSNGFALIEIIDMTGKEVFEKQYLLDQGDHIFSLNGISGGVYLINITGVQFQYNIKFLSVNNSFEMLNTKNIELNYIGKSKWDNSKPQFKKNSGTYNLFFENGDELIFTGYSGKYVATINKSPLKNEIIAFDFKSSSLVPLLKTIEASSITYSSAVSGGVIIDAVSSEIMAKGVCWSTKVNPTINNFKTNDGPDTGQFISKLSGLLRNTTYFVRAYATNSSGTGYGNNVSFTTQVFDNDTVIDIDGNVYHTTTIYDQVWMAKNLKTKTLNDGTPIPLGRDAAVWYYLKTPGYCWYDNDDTYNKNTYGALYNWYTVQTGKLCPVGWHVPNNQEWYTLIMSLGGYNVAGGSMKEEDTAHWNSPNIGATNISGFTALPGGSRSIICIDYSYAYIGVYGNWWSTNAIDKSTAYIYYLDHDIAQVFYSDRLKTDGFSIRCLKD